MKREWLVNLVVGLVVVAAVMGAVEIATLKQDLAEMQGRIAELEAGQAAAPVVSAVPEPDPAPVAPTDRGAVKEGTMGSWDGQVGHSLDDAHCTEGVGGSAWHPGLDYIRYGPCPEERSAWLRFEGVAVPQAANITKAYLSFCAYETIEGSNTVTLWGQDEDDAGRVASCAELVGKGITTATSEWAQLTWIGGQWYDMPDSALLEAVVQEILDRPGWVEGNAMAFIFSGLTGYTLDWWAYDGDLAKAAKLHIEWRPPISTEDTAVVADTVRLGLGPGPDPDDGGTTGLSDGLVLTDTLRMGLRLSDTLVLSEDTMRVVRPCIGRAIPGQPCPKP